jgi:hypothetical protein
MVADRNASSIYSPCCHRHISAFAGSDCYASRPSVQACEHFSLVSSILIRDGSFHFHTYTLLARLNHFMNTPTANLRLCLHKLRHPDPVREKLRHGLVCHLCLGSKHGWRPSLWCRHTICISRRDGGVRGEKGEAGIESRVLYFEEDDLDEVAHITCSSVHVPPLTTACLLDPSIIHH